MERSEPTLVPEWLKNAGSLNGGSSISRSDDQTSSKLARNMSFVNNNNNNNNSTHDLGRSFSSDRTTSSYFRRSSSSNGSSHLSFHSSFGRKKHDRDCEKDTCDFRDKEKSVLGDRRLRDISDNMFSKYDSDGLGHSHSTVYGKRAGTWHKKVVTESSTNSGNNVNGLLTKVSPIRKKATFERDFPSLGAEERVVNSDVGRVSSPGLSSAVQTLPNCTSSVISGEKWTSALAEVPVLVGNNGIGISSVTLGSTSSLNMAEAVAQGPTRAQSTTQLSVGTQRREELAIKQSRQLIPVTPSLPKILATNSSDKLKNKAGQQQQPISSSVVANQSPRGGPGKSEISKAPNMGKLHVLKPVREKNGATTVVKDNSSPMSGSKPVISTITPPSVFGSAATKGPVNDPVRDRKSVSTVLEKKPTSQARSRNDFFNSVREQSMTSSSPVAVLPSFSDKLADVTVVSSPNTCRVDDASLGVRLSVAHLSDEGEWTCNGDAQKLVSNGKKHPSCDPMFTEEEEAAFLRSLGWEENAEEGGLTDEEISAFFRDVAKYINSKPFLKILQVQLFPFESQIGGVGGISSGSNSSDAKLES